MVILIFLEIIMAGGGTVLKKLPISFLNNKFCVIYGDIDDLKKCTENPVNENHSSILIDDFLTCILRQKFSHIDLATNQSK